MGVLIAGKAKKAGPKWPGKSLEITAAIAAGQ